MKRSGLLLIGGVLAVAMFWLPSHLLRAGARRGSLSTEQTLDYLELTLGRDSAHERRTMALHLTKCRVDDPVVQRAILKRLRTSTPDATMRLLEVLEVLGRAGAFASTEVEALLTRSQVSGLRDAAATALGQIGDRESVAPLLTAVQIDSELSVRASASRSVLELATREVSFSSEDAATLERLRSEPNSYVQLHLDLAREALERGSTTSKPH